MTRKNLLVIFRNINWAVIQEIKSMQDETLGCKTYILGVCSEQGMFSEFMNM